MKAFEFGELPLAPLVVDAAYRGGRSGNAGDDPLGPLMRVSNSGGFRYRGNLERLELVCLTTTLSDPNWPDGLDRETGVFTYYGDNKHPGRSLHETPRKGNLLLSRIFEDAHGGSDDRARVPPVFLFASTGEWRDVEFLGLAVPGTGDLRASEDLVAIWRVAAGRRFQNYRARLTVLDTGEIRREWLQALIGGERAHDLAPQAWRDWVASGRARPLLASRTIEHRTRREQVPSDPQDQEMVAAIHHHFEGRAHAFEHCAAALTRLMLPEVASLDVTRPSRDGGRDGVGKLRVGTGPGAILVDFALEAKCYGQANSVGVRELSRLISRLRHRQFGVLVTTSWVDAQAYQELKEDQHPIIVMAAADIVSLLKAHGYSDVATVRRWLEAEFPIDALGASEPDAPTTEGLVDG
jgi:hypothetical protein